MANGTNGNGNAPQREQFYQFMTRSAFLHLEDALDIDKVRVFAGKYQRGEGAQATAAHFIDLDSARVLFSDLSAGQAAIDYCEFKGSPRGPEGKPVSRVLKVRSGKDGKVWVRLESGPGKVIGQGAVKPAGEPTTVINVPFTQWQAREMGMAALEFLRAQSILAALGKRPKPGAQPRPNREGDRSFPQGPKSPPPPEPPPLPR